MTDEPEVATWRSWLMLTIGTLAQVVTTIVVTSPAFLLPYLMNVRGMSLGEAGWLAAAPNIGLVLALVAWGAVADRVGERIVIILGLALTALASALPLLGEGSLLLALGLAGASSAAVNASTGRVVVGWFPRRRRGMAMGIRQMSQPLGTAVGALIVPALAGAGGVFAVMATAALLNLAIGLLALGWLRNPPLRPAPVQPAGVPRNPYREAFLWRIHLASALLVVPQFLMATFSLVWLVGPVGMGTTAAGLVVAAAQVLGALGRIAVGWASDRMGSRMRPLRIVAYSAVGVMVVLTLVALDPSPVLAGVIVVVATVVSVADNGLAFAAVAEAAGPGYSGKALGAQNTGQFLVAAAVGPGVGALVTGFGFPVAFAFTALAPILAVPLVPREDRDRS